MLKKKKIELSESQRRKIWHTEIEKRKDFGISDEIFISQFNSRVPYCGIKFSRDFENLFFSATAKGNEKSETKQKCISAVCQYIKYTFTQIKDAGGALQMSKTCPFVQIILKENIQYKSCGLHVFYRIKGAVDSSIYPVKVNEVFKSDSNCRAVVYSYVSPIVRNVLIEKKQKRKH